MKEIKPSVIFVILAGLILVLEVIRPDFHPSVSLWLLLILSWSFKQTGH